MRKLIMFAVFALLLFGFSTAVKAEQPTCSNGYHYVGNYEEETTCQNVCTKKFWGICIKWENKCTTTGEWVGACEADAVEEEETIEDDETPAPVETPKAIASSGGTPLWLILAGQCKEENIEYSEWSECLGMFNLQIRTAKSLNGCRLTGFQQANLIKRCGSEMLGLGL